MFILSHLKFFLTITAKNTNYSIELGKPVSVSRIINLNQHSKAFNLPEVTTKPFTYENIFVGDVLQGGSCNVDVLSFCPHNLTHVETSAHILDQSRSNAKIQDIPLDYLQGLVYLIDVSNLIKENDTLITKDVITKELKKIYLPVSAIAIKTQSSQLRQDYDFSGKDFVALDELTAKELTNFEFDGQEIKTLILDLPSTDPENDNGKLLAHRAFFKLPREGIDFEDKHKKVIVELAYFKELVQNYYYFIMTPARIQSNAMITDLLFYPIINH